MLRVDDRSSRSRSKSKTRDRSRSRSNVRAPRAPSPPSSTYAAAQPRYSYATPASPTGQPAAVSMPSMPGSFDEPTSPRYEVRSPTQATPVSPSYSPYPTGPGAGQANFQYATPGLPFGRAPPQAVQQAPGPDPRSEITVGDWSDLPPHERPQYLAQQAQQAQYQYPAAQVANKQPLASPGLGRGRDLSMSASGNTTLDMGHGQPQSPSSQYAQPTSPQYAQAPPYVYTTPSASQQQAYTPVPFQDQPPQQQYQYAPQPDKITYSAKPYSPPAPVPYTQTPQGSTAQQRQQSLAYSQNAHIYEINPGGGKVLTPPSPGLKPHRDSVSSKHARKSSSSAILVPQMSRLSVSGNRPDIQALVPGQLPPGSPLLEAYRGTYQSISPMPSPMMLPSDGLDDLPPLSLTSPRDSRHIEKKRVKLYDAEEDALALVDALSHRTPDAEPIIDILPALTHDQMMELRSEYKKHCKVQGRGINVAKHLKLKTSGNFGKVAYVTALGKYESEGHWANFWYQAHGSRRELLIEALMGRSNAEMRAIVDAFRDKRYGDSLARCMDKELKADKFREAVLLALQGKRQEETEVYPLEYRNRDVDALYRALKSTDGGERAIIEIVVRRSDAHLREVLKTYERKYQGNFAREALRKSGNLVGELIAHVLNGVINKPARDALLLHHAIADIASSKSASHPSPHPSSSSPPSSRHPARSQPSSSSADKDGLRYELLVSRLVRLHWDRAHLSRVKQHYRDRYAASLDDDLAAATKGDFGEFCLALCDVGR